MGHFIVTVTYNKIIQCHWFDDNKHVFDCCSSSRSHCNIFIDSTTHLSRNVMESLIKANKIYIHVDQEYQLERMLRTNVNNNR
jgi:polyphosphate kinase 2 (PPK2 family)